MKNVKKNRFSIKWVIEILVLIFIFLIGIYFFFNFQERFSISPADYSNYPKKGEKFAATVFSDIKSGRYFESIDNVQLTLTDITTGISQVNTTQMPNGFASFEVTVGNTYNFVANFHDSTKSITCTIGPTSKGWIRGVHVIISENNDIESIECSKLQFE